MNFALSEEQEAFREVLRRFLAEASPPAEVRRTLATPEGVDRGLWKRMAEELGLQGLLVPEAEGGQGFGFLEVGIALEELGRALVPTPFLASAVLATGALLGSSDTEARRRFLPALASGGSFGALALLDPDSGWNAAQVRMAFARDGAGYRLSGEKRYVEGGGVADLLVVAARRPGSAGLEGLSLFLVDGAAPGLSRAALAGLDPTRRLAHLTFDGVAARLLGAEGGAGAVLQRVLDLGAAGLAAEDVGGAERCLEMAVAYARQRVQFARPIGSFQAVKHKAAEVLLELESARAAAQYAAWTAAEAPDELPLAASLAKAVCGEAYLRAAAENIQIHGGVGFTWEHDAHLYYRRARANETLFGEAREHRARIAERLGFA
jgi:alkylation response protein AidB-like acyl-CoA dehydrogenase